MRRIKKKTLNERIFSSVIVLFSTLIETNQRAVFLTGQRKDSTPLPSKCFLRDCQTQFVRGRLPLFTPTVRHEKVSMTEGTLTHENDFQEFIFRKYKKEKYRKQVFASRLTHRHRRYIDPLRSSRGSSLLPRRRISGSRQ